MPSQPSVELISPSVPTSLAARLSESLRSTPRDRKAGVYYPSEAGYCLRKLFYSYTESPKIYGDDTLAIFALGDAVHEKIATMLRRCPNVRLIANEKSYVGTIDLEGGDGFTISGRLDDLVEMDVVENEKNQDKTLETLVAPGKIAGNGEVPQENNVNPAGQKIDDSVVISNGNRPISSKKVFVVDVKTVKSFDYLDAPKREHVLQLTFYLRMLRETYPGICGKLLYIKKDDFTMMEFDVPYDDKNWRELISRLTVLHRSLTVPAMRRHGAEPESKFVKSMNWGCGYCSHRDKCEFDCGKDGKSFGGMKLVSPMTPADEAIEAFL
jgi:hypothetical protein